MSKTSETLADLITGDPPPADAKIWNRIERSLRDARPLPDALEPALTLVFFRAVMVPSAVGRVGGFMRFYAEGRSRDRAARLAQDLAEAGLLETSNLAMQMRELFECDDAGLGDRIQILSSADSHPIFTKAQELSDTAAGLADYEAATWAVLQNAAAAATTVLAAPEKRGFFDKIFNR